MNVQKSLFKEVSRGEPLLGVNPLMPAQSHGYQNLEAERLALGEKGDFSHDSNDRVELSCVLVIAGNHAPVAQEFLKRGCPKCLRGKMWAQVLGSQIKEEVIHSIFCCEYHDFYLCLLQHFNHFEELKQFVLQYDMIVDKLLIKASWYNVGNIAQIT